MATRNDLEIESLASDAERRRKIKKLSHAEILRILLEDFCRITIKTIRTMIVDDEDFVKKMKITEPPPKNPPITTPENPAWTVTLIERLKKYIDGNRYFNVTYREHKVYGIDLVPEEHADKFAPDSAEFYLQEYDDARPEGRILSEADPTDFCVYLLKPVAWQDQDPNWNEADPESWTEYQSFQKASEE